MLVGGDRNHGMDYDFPYTENFIIPTDELIFFRVVATHHQPEHIGDYQDHRNPYQPTTRGFEHFSHQTDLAMNGGEQRIKSNFMVFRTEAFELDMAIFCRIKEHDQVLSLFNDHKPQKLLRKKHGNVVHPVIHDSRISQKWIV